jgi:hypothetical protein
MSIKKKKKFRKTSEMMEEFWFVILIIGFNRPNTGMDDSIQTGSGAHPISCQMGTRWSLPKGKVAQVLS